MQTWGKCADSTQIMAAAGNQFFFLISVTIMLFENVLLLGDMYILLNECNCIKIVLSGTNKENEVIKTIDYM